MKAFCDVSGSIFTRIGSGFLFPKRKASSRASRAMARYCSNWSAEKKSADPVVSNPSEFASSGRFSASIEIPRSDSMVFSYSRRFSRRIVLVPPVSLSCSRATTSCSERSRSRVIFSSCLSWGSSSGGISPEFIAFRTFCQISALPTESIRNDNASRSMPPSSVSESWHSKQ